MPKVENKKSWIEVEVKALDATDEFPNGSFECILSTGDLDRDGEHVDFGCFNPLPDYLPAIVDHDAQAKNVVGWGIPTYENNVLMFRGGFDADEFSQIIRGKLVSKSIRKMSIGFMNAKRERKDGVPHVISAEALEASFVVIPANTGADVVNAKAYGPIEAPAGSFEEVQEDVTEALYGYYGDEAYVCLIATFADHVVYAVRHWPEQAQDGTYSVPFEQNEDGVSFSADPVTVEIQQVISEKRAKHMTENYLPAWAANIDERKTGRTEWITKNFGTKSATVDEVAEDLLAIEAELVDMELDDDSDDCTDDDFTEIGDLDRELESLLEGDADEDEFDADAEFAEFDAELSAIDDDDAVSSTSESA